MFTEEQLMLLEQLTYLGESVYKKAGINNPEKILSVADMVCLFTKEELKELSTKGEIGFTDGSEWAAIISAIQKDESLMNLQLVSHDAEQGIFCFADPKHDDEVIVAFRGTTNGKEWKDNVEGLTKSDTYYQKEALDFVESLPYDNITVVGHSKGGNKAQYVALLSDKVQKCVSMDGQGFSQEFFDKYWAEIEVNAKKIKNYSVSNDYVNILMFYVPGAEQIYCHGENENGLKNHSQSSFFQYSKDEDGNWEIELNSNGHPNLIGSTQDEVMSYLHQFTCFIINEMPNEDKENVMNYLSDLLPVVMDEKFKLEKDGVIYTLNPKGNEKGFPELMALDLDTLAIVVAYFVKYVEEYNLTETQIEQLLSAFGIEKMIEDCLEANNKQQYLDICINALPALIKFIGSSVTDEVTDNKRDPIIEIMLSIFADDWLYDFFGKDINVDEVWRNIEKEYKKIGNINQTKAKKDGIVRNGTELDFSQDVYETLINTISLIEGFTFQSVSDWKNYSSEEWYGPLSIGIAVNGITQYFEYLSEINTNCKKQINNIFKNVGNIDSRYSIKVLDITRSINDSKNKVLSLADNIVVK